MSLSNPIAGSGATPGCAYTRLDNNIHEFVFLKSNYQAIDEWIALSEQALQEVGTANRFVQLVDATIVTGLPLAYAYQQVKLLESRYAHIEEWRIAFLLQQSTMRYMINAYIKMLKMAVVGQFFAPNQRDEAIAWLREATPSA